MTPLTQPPLIILQLQQDQQGPISPPDTGFVFTTFFDPKTVTCFYVQRTVFKFNLDGSFLSFRAAARHMVERAKNGDPFGRLVGTASLAAISGPARNEHYAASKGGLISMMNAMAVEFARYGVTSNAILPGWIETEMTDKTFANERFAGNVMPRVPMRRWGQPDDFGGIAVYIMSEASSFHTAESFLIDGGYWVF